MPKRIALSLLSITGFLSLFCYGANAQLPEQPTVITVKQLPAWVEAPIEIEEIKIAGKKVEIDKPFQATDTWLKDLSVTVRNVSQVPIVGFTVAVRFPTDGEGKAYLPDTEIMAGRDYTFSPEGPGKEMTLSPNETIEASVTQEWYDNIRFHVTHKDGIPSGILRRATLVRVYAGFDANHIWLRGASMQRDENDPNRFKPDEKQRKKISQALNSQRFQKVSYGRLPDCRKIAR